MRVPSPPSLFEPVTFHHLQHVEPHREEIPQQPIPAPDVGPSQPYIMVHSHSYVQPAPTIQTPMALYPPSQPVYTNPRPHMMPQITHPSSMTQPAQPIVNSISARDLEQYGYTILDILGQRGCNVPEMLRQAKLQAEQMYGVSSAQPPLSQPPTPGAFGRFNNPVPDTVDHLSAGNRATNSPSSSEPVPKSRRKSSSSTRSKGKSKKDDQPIPRPRRRSPSSSEPSWSPLLPPSSPSSESHPPTPPAPRPTGSTRPPGMVFASSSGAPLSFFVQIDLTHRLSLVNKIKVCLVPHLSPVGL